MRKIFLIIIGVIVLIVVGEIKSNREKEEAEVKIKSAYTFSESKTNDEAMREILSNVEWSEAKRLSGQYNMTVSGFTSDLSALEKYKNTIKRLYIAPDAETAKITFYL